MNKLFYPFMALSLLCFFVGVGYALTKGTATPLPTSLGDFVPDLGKNGAIFALAVLLLLGVETPYNMGVEIKSIRKSAPWMVFGGSLMLGVLYLMTTIGILLTTPAGKADPYVSLSLIYGNAGLPWLVGITAFIYTFTNLGQITLYEYTYARLLFISGVEKHLPRVFAYVDPRTRTPVAAILLQGAILTIIVLIMYSNSSLNNATQVMLAALTAIWCLSDYFFIFPVAIAVVLFVNVVALSFESGAANVYSYIRSTQYGLANVWLTPPSGFKLDQNTGFFATEGTLQENLADQILQFTDGKGIKVITAHLATVKIPLVVYGRSDRQEVSLSQAASTALKLKTGDKLTVDQVSVRVAQVGNVPDVGAGGLIELPLLVAQKILHVSSHVNWVMLDTNDIQKLRQYLMTQMNAAVTTDPTVKNLSKEMIAYVLEGKLGKSDLVTFNVKLAALYFNQASSTLIGWLAKITLGLGFVLMLSAALLSIEERRREFGILTAVGVSGDILYLFLLESLILFVGSTALGLIIGSWLLLVLTPALFNWTIILESSVLVACYLPPMVIFGSLIPAQQLLRKSPLELLRSAI